MSAALQRRARAFLERPTPAQLDYVLDSISESIIAAYAEHGAAAPHGELRDILELCALESDGDAKREADAVRAYFEESSPILAAIHVAR